MDSLFTASGLKHFSDRIDGLRPEAPAEWGKMNVTQMLAHCQAPLNVGTGDHSLPKYNFFMRFIGGMVRKSILKDDAPFKRNQPTDKSFVVAGQREFSVEKDKLKESIRKFSEMGRDGKLNEAHAFFGHMSQNDWDRLQTKHLDHHLRQFGG